MDDLAKARRREESFFIRQLKQTAIEKSIKKISPERLLAYFKYIELG